MKKILCKILYVVTLSLMMLSIGLVLISPALAYSYIPRTDFNLLNGGFFINYRPLDYSMNPMSEKSYTQVFDLPFLASDDDFDVTQLSNSVHMNFDITYRDENGFEDYYHYYLDFVISDFYYSSDYDGGRRNSFKIKSEYSGFESFQGFYARLFFTGSYVSLQSSLNSENDGSFFALNPGVPENLDRDDLRIEGSFYLSGSNDKYDFDYMFTDLNASDPDWLSLNVYDIIYDSGVNLLPYIPDSYDLKVFLEAYDSYDPLTATNEEKQYLFGFLDSIYIDTLEIDLPMVHDEQYMFESYFNDSSPMEIKYFTANDDQFVAFRYNDVRNSAGNITGYRGFTSFIGNAVSGFLDVQIMPGLSLSLILVVIICFSLVLWFLKVFAGG